MMDRLAQSATRAVSIFGYVFLGVVVVGSIALLDAYTLFMSGWREAASWVLVAVFAGGATWLLGSSRWYVHMIRAILAIAAATAITLGLMTFAAPVSGGLPLMILCLGVALAGVFAFFREKDSSRASLRLACNIFAIPVILGLIIFLRELPSGVEDILPIVSLISWLGVAVAATMVPSRTPAAEGDAVGSAEAPVSSGVVIRPCGSSTSPHVVLLDFTQDPSSHTFDAEGEAVFASVFDGLAAWLDAKRWQLEVEDPLIGKRSGPDESLLAAFPSASSERISAHAIRLAGESEQMGTRLAHLWPRFERFSFYLQVGDTGSGTVMCSLLDDGFQMAIVSDCANSREVTDILKGAIGPHRVEEGCERSYDAELVREALTEWERMSDRG
ncbi:MAG: hypothetical protein M1617_00715 [Actinobacteria bacterium]|nr:hypothetical protein [Actinomycetota bacterium]MCL5886818.1 hypothetical protein [Actinomycetota bacterium]